MQSLKLKKAARNISEALVKLGKLVKKAINYFVHAFKSENSDSQVNKEPVAEDWRKIDSDFKKTTLDYFP